MATALNFHKISQDREETIAVLALNRESAANAFNGAIIDALISDLKRVKETSHCRALVVTGKGKHFSAGADLGWMKESATLSHQENIKDAEKLTGLFESLENLPVPTIAAVRGAAFGGAVGLVACCDIAIAEPNAKFCLSEVKLGLLPAVILPHLARRMMPGALRRLSLTARLFRGDEALQAGLIDRVTDDLATVVREELNLLLQGGRQAQTALKALHKYITTDSNRQGPHTAEAIATARTSAEGQAGLSAFFEKKPSPWVMQLDEDWTFDR